MVVSGTRQELRTLLQAEQEASELHARARTDEERALYAQLRHMLATGAGELAAKRARHKERRRSLRAAAVARQQQHPPHPAMPVHADPQYAMGSSGTLSLPQVLSVLQATYPYQAPSTAVTTSATSPPQPPQQQQQQHREYWSPALLGLLANPHVEEAQHVAPPQPSSAFLSGGGGTKPPRHAAAAAAAAAAAPPLLNLRRVQTSGSSSADSNAGLLGMTAQTAVRCTSAASPCPAASKTAFLSSPPGDAAVAAAVARILPRIASWDAYFAWFRAAGGSVAALQREPPEAWPHCDDEDWAAALACAEGRGGDAPGTELLCCRAAVLLVRCFRGGTGALRHVGGGSDAARRGLKSDAALWQLLAALAQHVTGSVEHAEALEVVAHLSDDCTDPADVVHSVLERVLSHPSSFSPSPSPSPAASPQALRKQLSAASLGGSGSGSGMDFMSHSNFRSARPKALVRKKLQQRGDAVAGGGGMHGSGLHRRRSGGASPTDSEGFDETWGGVARRPSGYASVTPRSPDGPALAAFGSASGLGVSAGAGGERLQVGGGAGTGVPGASFTSLLKVMSMSDFDDEFEY